MATPAKATRAAKPRTAKPPARPGDKPAARASRSKTGTPPRPTPPKPQAPRDFDKTGNVRVLGTEGSTPETSAASPTGSPEETNPAPAGAATAEASTVTGPAAAPQPTAAADLAAVTAEAAAATAEPATGSAAGLPLANYDELSVSSLRARLRNLDIDQVRRLAEYERTHAARADVIATFERRIAKLEAGA